MTETLSASRWSADRRPAGWSAVDAALATLFLVLLVTEVAPNADMTPRGPLLLGSVVVAVPLAWRRSHPALVAVVVCSGHFAVSAVATGEFAPQLAILPVLVALYTASSLTRGVRAVATGAVTAVLTGVAWIVTEEGHPDDFWPWMLWAGAWAAGTFVRRRTEVAAEHAGRSALLEVEARTAAAESAQAERDRIAREMHDVVAHAVSVMVVQAGAERLRLGAEAGRTGDALAAIEESGRTALTELRGMLGVLRDGAGELHAPLPGLAAVAGLVEGVKEAGLPVDLVCRPPELLTGDPVAGSSAGLAAYRIVQEALTNVMRHQGLVPTRVELELSGSRLCLTVANSHEPASGADRDPRAAGRGLAGMRERAAALGGTFEAGVRGDEYVVSARLPLRSGARV
ncbi:sensor histidine kinase [Nocardioides dilutus]